MEETKVLLQCEYCKNKAKLIVRTPSIQAYKVTYSYRDEITWRILECPVCSALNLSSTYARIFTEEAKWEDGAEDEELEEYIIYPVAKKNENENGKNLELLPIKIREAYKLALKVRDVPNAFAVQIARTLEIVCKYERAEGKGLAQNLENLAKAGRMPLALASIANEFKVLRNIGAHADRTDDDVETWEVPTIEEFADAILEYLYIAPQKFTRLQENLKRTHPF
jgi:Domain of unknown function (DUF4145)